MYQLSGRTCAVLSSPHYRTGYLARSGSSACLAEEMLEKGSTVVGESVDQLLFAVGVVCHAKRLTNLVPGHATNARSSNRFRQRFVDCN